MDVVCMSFRKISEQTRARAESVQDDALDYCAH